jgi:hypothetical protein
VAVVAASVVILVPREVVAWRLVDGSVVDSVAVIKK